MDEAERLRNTQDPATAEILSMLLAGYKKGGTATRLEPVGDSGFKTVSFDVFGPKALACIAGLPPALASRAIPVTMFRSPPGSEKPRRRIDADPEGWQRLRDASARAGAGTRPDVVGTAEPNRCLPDDERAGLRAMATALGPGIVDRIARCPGAVGAAARTCPGNHRRRP